MIPEAKQFIADRAPGIVSTLGGVAAVGALLYGGHLGAQGAEKSMREEVVQVNNAINNLDVPVMGQVFDVSNLTLDELGDRLLITLGAGFIGGGGLLFTGQRMRNRRPSSSDSSLSDRIFRQPSS